MPICPFCMLLVATSKRGYIHRHNVPLTNRRCRATGLTVQGAKDYLTVVPTIKEYDVMGMFDKPQYLTGENGYVIPGETFWIHQAKVDGTATVRGETRDQAKLEVSKERDGERTVLFTSGRGIVGQIRRMDDSDRQAMPMEVRLDQVPSGQGNPTNVLTPATENPPTRVEDDIPF